MHKKLACKAIYAGTFDVPTIGHKQIIEKAANLFNEIYVVVSTAKNKTPWFTEQERIYMLSQITKDIEKKYNCNIIVEALPPSTYLAIFAKEKGADFLIRGIRDIWDFNYEQNIYYTNRRIEPEIETIYLMPDTNYTMVSSSWVKNLVGCCGWIDVLSEKVDSCVIDMLVEKYLKERLFLLIKRMVKLNNESASTSLNIVWNKLYNSYNKSSHNSYHNLKHIVNCIEVLDKYYLNNEGLKDIIELALFMHDIDSSEDKSIDIFKSFVYELEIESHYFQIDMVCKLINATKHESCYYDTTPEIVISSIDLWILGQNETMYNQYVNSVKEEYFHKEKISKKDFEIKWKKGRSQFLEKMLKRKCIYPWVLFNKLFETQARKNMQKELLQYKSTKK